MPYLFMVSESVPSPFGLPIHAPAGPGQESVRVGKRPKLVGDGLIVFL